MFTLSHSTPRLPAFLALLVSWSLLVAQQLDLSDFCFAGLQTVEINNKLFPDIARGFKADSKTVMQSSYNSACDRVASIRKLGQMPEYKGLRSDVKKLVDPLVNAYDSMIDQYAHFFYNVGKAGQHAAFQEAWPVVEQTIRLWEDEGYKDLYEDWEAKHKLALEQIRSFAQDIVDVQRNLGLPNANGLLASNRLRSKAVEQKDHWPMCDSDLEFWKFNEIYKLSFMDASCKLTSQSLSEFQKLDQFSAGIGKFSTYINTIDVLFDTWDRLLEPIEQRANLALQYSDDHFAQDHLNDYFREACEDCAEEVLRNLSHLKREVAAGSRNLDKASSLATNSHFKSLAMKNSPLTRGYDGSQKKTVQEAFQDLADTVRKHYLLVAMDSKQSTDPVKTYCSAAYDTMIKNNQLLKNASGKLNFFGMNAFRTDCSAALKACKDIKYLSKLNELDKIPKATRDSLKPGLEAYDMAVLDQVAMFQKIVSILENDKFKDAKQELANLAVYQPPNLEANFAKIEKYAKSMQRIYEDFSRDMKEIKQKNGGKLGDMPRYSANNKIGQVVTKEKKYPVGRNIMNEFDIQKLYDIPWCNDNLIMLNNSLAQAIEDLDVFSNHLKTPAEKVKLAIENYKKIIDIIKSHGGKDAAALTFLKNPQVIDYMTPQCLHYATALLTELGKARQGFIENVERHGIKDAERLTSISSKPCTVTLARKQGPLWTFPNGTTHKTIEQTFMHFRTVMIKTWQDNTR